MFEPDAASVPSASGVRVWPVGSLLRAIADSLEARFNPVAVKGEVSSFSQAASGHCYFSLKDEQGQVRCAMFRRAAGLLDFAPRDGQLVEVRGRLGVYEPRGELQLIVEAMQLAGKGNLFEQFLQLKARLEAEGLFDGDRKKALPVMPRAIGIVTSLGAAALRDVVTTLQRRAPHIPVVIYPASVQGAQAPQELRQALRTGWQRAEVDVLLLVRGGGALEDLWAFNDEQLARTLVESPLPVICGVGHETDFTIADFCADVRAPTPTAAAEICVAAQKAGLDALAEMQRHLRRSVERHLQGQAQRLDWAASRVSRPSHLVTRQQARLDHVAQRLRHGLGSHLKLEANRLKTLETAFPQALAQSLVATHRRLERAQLRLEPLDPALVLQRGYAWLADMQGHPITTVTATKRGQALRATLADGEVDLTVSAPRLI